jgi:hypothetical protein
MTTPNQKVRRGKNIAIIIVVSMKDIMRSAGPPRNLEQGTFQSLPS